MDSTLRRPARAAWAVVVGACVAFELFVVAHPFGAREFGAVEAALLGVACATAAVACWRRSLRERGRARSAWAYLAASAGVFTISQLLFTVEVARGQVTFHDVTAPSGIVATLALPFAVVGLSQMVSAQSSQTRVIEVLDLTIVGTCWLFVAWAWVLGPVYQRHKADLPHVSSLVAFLVVSLVLAVLAFLVATRGPGAPAGPLLAVAFGWLSATELAFAAHTYQGDYRIGDATTDIGWFAPLLLAALAAHQPMHPSPRGDWGRRRLVALLVPVVALLAVVVSGVFVVRREQQIDLVLQASAVALVVLVLARQTATLLESSAITQHLERRVEERSAAARRSEAWLQTVLRSSSDVIALVDDQGVVLYANPTSWSLIGLPPHQLVGRTFLDFVHPDDRPATRAALAAVGHDPINAHVIAFRFLCRDERWCEVEATVSPVRDEPLASGVLLNIRDVSERSTMQQELRQQASYDALTSLANRRLFDDRVRHALDRAERTGEAVSVLFVDLDHFKRVNDTLGHDAGDALLVHVAERLRTCLRPADTAARLGGDEFAVLLEATTADQAHEVAGRVVEALSTPYQVAESTMVVTASVGVTTTIGGVSGRPDLMRHADAAMYRAKARGRGRVAVFEPGMEGQRDEQRRLESELRTAAERGQLRLRYQPVVDLQDGRVTGLEALLRWEVSPEHLLAPARFLPLAEERGLVRGLDRWVLQEACRRVRAWQEEFPVLAPLEAHVNVAAAGLRDPRLVDEVRDALAQSGLPAASLVLEVTERAVLDHPDEVAAVVAGLHDLGVRICLDDFGTGYGALATLQRLPFDQLKVDPSFVARLESGPRARRLVRGLLEMAQALGLTTVAEAVETPRQEKYLRRMGCAAAQGHLYAEPLDADEAEALLARRTTKGAPPLLRTASAGRRDADDDGR